MSNVLGTITPLKDIVARAHAKGVPVLAEGCQGAVHEPVDVQALDIDFYVITGHKLYGPTGIGALYAKKAHLKKMRPFNGGGEMIREVARDRITYADPPARFEAGTPAIVQAIGANAFATPAFEQLTGLRWRRPPGAPTGVHEFLHLSSGFRWRFMRRGDVCEDDSEEEEEEEEDQEDGFEMAYKPVSDAQALPEMLRERFTFSKAQMPGLLAKLLAALQRRGD